MKPNDASARSSSARTFQYAKNSDIPNTGDSNAIYFVAYTGLRLPGMFVATWWLEVRGTTEKTRGRVVLRGQIDDDSMLDAQQGLMH